MLILKNSIQNLNLILKNNIQYLFYYKSNKKFKNYIKLFVAKIKT